MSRNDIADSGADRAAKPNTDRESDEEAFAPVTAGNTDDRASNRAAKPTADRESDDEASEPVTVANTVRRADGGAKPTADRESVGNTVGNTDRGTNICWRRRS